jgi:hypothetical protein
MASSPGGEIYGLGVVGLDPHKTPVLSRRSLPHTVIGPHPVQDFVSFRNVFSMDSRLLILIRISAIFDLALARIPALVVVGDTRSDNNFPISLREKPNSFARLKFIQRVADRA